MIKLAHAIPLNAAFKTDRIRSEYLCGRLEAWMTALLVVACAYILVRCKAVPEITEIWRSYTEQLKIYPDEPDKKSIHQYWRGVDIVVRALGRAEHEEICDWINTHFPYGKSKLQTCIYHDAGTGPHLHLQVKA